MHSSVKLALRTLPAHSPCCATPLCMHALPALSSLTFRVHPCLVMANHIVRIPWRRWLCRYSLPALALSNVTTSYAFLAAACFADLACSACLMGHTPVYACVASVCPTPFPGRPCPFSWPSTLYEFPVDSRFADIPRPPSHCHVLPHCVFSLL